MSRRADRLFQIVQILRTRRRVTAALLAERLEVSERTVYRDIRDLSLSGVPIQGEAGSGYRLMPGFDIPPLMFTGLEVEALIAAIGMLQTWSGDVLAQAAGSALRDCCEKEQKLLLAEKEVQQKSRRISLAETAGRVGKEEQKYLEREREREEAKEGCEALAAWIAAEQSCCEALGEALIKKEQETVQAEEIGRASCRGRG